MNEKSKRSIVQRVVYLISNTSDLMAEGKYRTKLLGYESSALTLVDEAADAYNNLIKRLLQEDLWSERFSEKYIDKALRKLLVTLSSEQDITSVAPRYVDELVTQLSGYCRHQTVYIPLVGLKLDDDQFEIGQVVLERMSAPVVEGLVNNMQLIVSTSKNSEEDKQPFVALQRAHLESLTGTICARFQAVAEPIRAKERAKDECRRILDLVRYSIPSLYSEKVRVAVGLPGEVSAAQRIIPTLSPQNFNLVLETVGPLTPFEFSPQNVEIMKRLGVFEVSAILRKPHKKQTDFEETLLRGIHWFADAQVQPEVENRLLSLIACLETFLTPRDGNPIGTAIAEGVAIVVGEELESRRRLKKRVKELYRLRSGVSHGGYKAVLETDLRELTSIARLLTVKMIEHKDEFPTQKALLGWIEERKLG